MSVKLIHRLALVGITGMATLTAPSQAGAEPHRVLFLGISRSAGTLEPDEVMTNWIRERLRLQNVPLVESTHLLPTQVIMRDPKMLAELGEKKNATWVLGGEMRQNLDPAKDGREYSTAGILIDVKEKTPLLTQGLCSDCSDETKRAGYMTKALLDLMLKRGDSFKKKRASQIISPILYALGAATVALGLGAIPTGIQRESVTWKALGGVSLGLAAGSLAGAYYYSLP